MGIMGLVMGVITHLWGVRMPDMGVGAVVGAAGEAAEVVVVEAVDAYDKPCAGMP